MRTLIDHLEDVLGPIRKGWSVDPDGVKMPFQVVQYSRGPHAGSVAYSTLGLSRHPLPSPTPGKAIRQELLMVVPDTLPTDPVVSVLVQVGNMAHDAQRALLRGQVVGPAGPLVPQSQLTALYVTMPVYFPDDFATYSGPDGGIVIAWLVPITTGEADYVFAHGWDAFEQKLVEVDPDLADFYRPGLTF